MIQIEGLNKAAVRRLVLGVLVPPLLASVLYFLFGFITMLVEGTLQSEEFLDLKNLALIVLYAYLYEGIQAILGSALMERVGRALFLKTGNITRQNLIIYTVIGTCVGGLAGVSLYLLIPHLASGTYVFVGLGLATGFLMSFYFLSLWKKEIREVARATSNLKKPTESPE